MTFKGLRKAQEELEKSDDEMAEILGIKVRSYRYRKSGERPIRLTEAEKIERLIKEKREEQS